MSIKDYSCICLLFDTNIKSIKLFVFPRKIDLDNVEKLKIFKNTKVVLSFKELKLAIEERKKCLKKYSF